MANKSTPALASTRALAGLQQRMKAAGAAHARAMSKPMLGAHMAGDPWIDRPKQNDQALRERRAVQYAAALGQRIGSLPADLSGYIATWDGGAKVSFVPNDSRAPMLAYTIPEYVLDYDPDAAAIALPTPIDTPAPRCSETAEMSLPAPANDKPRKPRAPRKASKPKALPAPSADPAPQFKRLHIITRHGLRSISCPVF